MVILYLDSKTHIITDDSDNIVSLEKAKELCQAGQVEDCNVSFQRLAQYNFDFDKLDSFYRENP